MAGSRSRSTRFWSPICVKPLGAYMAQVFTGERTFLSPVLRPVERAIYWCCGVDEKQEQHWVTYTVAMLFFSVAGFVTLYALQRFQDVAAVQPAGHVGGRADLVLQHRGQLRHQHELAGLRRRDDDELSDPDGRSDGAQFRLGGDRHRARDRADPRLCPALGADRRQFLGRSDPLHALRPAADVDRRGAGAGLAGHAAEPRRLYRRDDARRRQAGHRAGAGRLADRDQAARHQWRRLLQRQLRPSVREPERDHQPDRDVGDPRDQRGADLHVRPHGRQHAPGLGACSP